MILSSMGGEGLWEIAGTMKHANNLHPYIAGHEEDQISAMPRTSQSGRQLIAGRETARPLRDRRHGRLDLGNKRQGTRGIIERNEIANLDQIGPCGR
jgi:hypothetical protein